MMNFKFGDKVRLNAKGRKTYHGDPRGDLGVCTVAHVEPGAKVGTRSVVTMGGAYLFEDCVEYEPGYYDYNGKPSLNHWRAACGCIMYPGYLGKGETWLGGRGCTVHSFNSTGHWDDRRAEISAWLKEQVITGISYHGDLPPHYFDAPAALDDEVCELCGMKLSDQHHTGAQCRERDPYQMGSPSADMTLDARIAATKVDNYEERMRLKYGRHWGGVVDPDDGGW